ncbi:hypothetical protein GUITHDRAFT_121274 [Guillardia theta CCMP2712]|uniref:RIC1 C-terminal alpha solenoid region domain-containing protein n=1 Tax=Guillardia theta (strain CCMP2712) TaxID=905079 RepID=L1I9N2_GUITC|nr:hypothetical protein GUITHDRAFT_121274 [Guillardia theta CCMP2712]EKX32565.1 hypothetical protein GUITHDRAFT_121274 [Guillardia theta CCMP2712]|eukprot:XP_005819545.1 hypothetical protein GUITHDRAFT_121274 [Guillardia theta CCMP2712]
MKLWPFLFPAGNDPERLLNDCLPARPRVAGHFLAIIQARSGPAAALRHGHPVLQASLHAREHQLTAELIDFLERAKEAIEREVKFETSRSHLASLFATSQLYSVAQLLYLVTSDKLELLVTKKDVQDMKIVSGDFASSVRTLHKQFLLPVPALSSSLISLGQPDNSKQGRRFLGDGRTWKLLSHLLERLQQWEVRDEEEEE